MADNKNSNQKPNQTRDLPSKPNDKKTDEKVKGGMMKKDSSSF